MIRTGVFGIGCFFRRHQAQTGIFFGMRRRGQAEGIRRHALPAGQELSQKEMQIASETQKQAMMLTSLRKTQTEVTDLKINNHFLFKNTGLRSRKTGQTRLSAGLNTAILALCRVQKSRQKIR